MSPLRLNGSSSGYVSLDAPASAGSNTLVLPTGNGTADQALVTNGSGTLSWSDRGRMTLATAQNSTSGTSIDFTGIPSWVKRVTVMFSGVSTNGTSKIQIQLGSGSVTTTGYVSVAAYTQTSATAAASNTSGFLTDNFGTASDVRSGLATLCNLTGNVWTVAGSWITTSSTTIASCSGSVTLSGTLDRIRITTVNGTDTFDAGSINIMYEG